MPRFASTTTSGGATADVRPLAGWQYEYLPWPALVRVLANASATGVTMAVNSGSEQIQRASPVDNTAAGASALPNSFESEPLVFHAPAGDRLELVLATTGALTYNIIVDVNPA